MTIRITTTTIRITIITQTICIRRPRSIRQSCGCQHCSGLDLQPR
jgi:hypothetical protein